MKTKPQPAPNPFAGRGWQEFVMRSIERDQRDRAAAAARVNSQGQTGR